MQLVSSLFSFSWNYLKCEFWSRDNMFLFLRNSSHVCACDWGPSEFKNLHGVVHCTQYKTGMCVSKSCFDWF